MIIIGNGMLLTNNSAEPFIADGAAAVDGESIAELGSGAALRERYPDAEYVDACGGLIMPGLIDAHSHMYRMFARGMKVSGQIPRSIAEKKRLIWQRIDSMLTLDDCIRSAYAAMAEALRCGVTTMIDMHECGSDPRATLLAIAGAACDIGMRTCLGFGAGAGGKAHLDAEIRENRGFMQYCASRPELLTRPFFGIDGLWQLEDSELWRCAVAAENCSALAISLEDGALELYDSIRRHGKTPIERLNGLGLIGERTIVCHCGAIDSADMDTLKASGASTTAVPCADGKSVCELGAVRMLLQHGVTPAIGSDGALASPLPAARHMMLCLDDGTSADSCRQAARMLFAGGDIVSRIFGKTVGRLVPGAAADIIIMDMPVYTEINSENVYTHLLYGDPRCTFSMINGRVAMRGGELLTVNEEYLKRRCAAAFAGIKQRLEEKQSD